MINRLKCPKCGNGSFTASGIGTVTVDKYGYEHNPEVDIDERAGYYCNACGEQWTRQEIETEVDETEDL